MNEDDLSDIQSSSEPQAVSTQSRSEITPTAVTPVASASKRQIQTRAPSPERDALKTLLEEKLAKVSRELENSQDFEQQAKLLELISKYLETLEKLKSDSRQS